MKFIIKPKTIIIKDLNTDKPIMHKDETTGNLEPVIATFYHFLIGSILKSPVFGKNAVTIMHAIDIKDKAFKTEDGECFEIDNEAHSLLLEAFNSDLPIVFDPAIAMQFKPFFDCILNATVTKPKAKVALPKTKLIKNKKS